MFEQLDLEGIQGFIFPLLKTLTGIDIESYAKDGSEYLIEAGDALADVAALLVLAGAALEDGKLSKEEINELIHGAKNIKEGIQVFTDLFTKD